MKRKKTKKKIKNPISAEALKKYEDFNRRKPDKISKINLPINSNTTLVKLGFIDNLEYVSDKAIFSSDKKTRKRKERTYIHDFNEHDKRPFLFTNESGNILIIFDPRNPIEVKAEGII